MTMRIRAFLAIALLCSFVLAVPSAQVSAQASAEAIQALDELNALWQAGREQEAHELFKSLDESTRAEIQALVRPSSYSASQSVSEVPDSAVSASATCYRASRTATWESALGADIYQMTHTINWCSNGSTIYSPSCSSFGQGVGYPWSLDRYDRYCDVIAGGVGTSHIKYETQATFKGCLPWTGCYDYQTEWVRLDGYYNQVYYWSHSG